MNWEIIENFSHTFGFFAGEARYVSKVGDSPISEILLKDNGDGNFKIKAYYKNPTDFELLAAAMVREGLPIPADPISKFMQIIQIKIYDKQVIGMFLRALIRVQTNVNELMPIVSNTFEVQFDDTYRPPIWTVQGNFNSILNSGASLNRKVAYVDTVAKFPISEIALCGYDDNSFSIQAVYKEFSDVEPIAKAMVKEGLPNSINRFGTSISIRTIDKQIIGVFLRALIQLQPNISEIKTILSNTLEVQFDDTYRPPVWLAQGNFSSIYNSGGLLNREIKYTNTIENSIISEIELLGYNDDLLQIYIRYNGDAPLSDILCRQNLMHLLKHQNINTLRLIGRSSHKQLILVVLQALMQIQDNLDQVIELMSNALEFKLDFEPKSLAFREQLHHKYNLDKTVLFSKMMPFLTLKEQCKLSEICADDATVIATRDKPGLEKRFANRFGALKL